MKRTSTLIFLTFCAFPIFIGCSCIEIEDPDVFTPTNYNDFVTTAFDTFWGVIKSKVTPQDYPELWIDFTDASKKLSKYGIDLEVQFINRMLKSDKLWSDYEEDRTSYEASNPEKSFKDQIILFISKTGNSKSNTPS